MEPKLSLYGYTFCPYCAMVLREIDRLGIDVELKDTIRDRSNKEALLAKMGRGTVPVLRIEENGEEHWLPESRDIVAYLRDRFGP
ncbi:MAG: glutathione S-transferase N-terminal domain-containing protein [Myxococcota bacterium]